ncbi:MAG: glyoxalase/bleomycin resistance/dioxygenase family protein, partial [Actinomycetota bacterium]|nr:glyoxalase/bleomycin resistance/dioxygenase family protein [Actinomycetota bacterium]
HLGVEVESRDEVAAEHARVTGAGLAAMVEGETTCCYAVQDKFWVEGGPTQFEIYTVLAPAEVMHETESSCCASDDAAAAADAEPVAAGRCC